MKFVVSLLLQSTDRVIIRTQNVNFGQKEGNVGKIRHGCGKIAAERADVSFKILKINFHLF